ncbi:MAG TPA: uracil-DNA glycosylase [Planctomycetota bacterium]|nr:uracil-DNA glycosylase [Planctomycetota bacterium]
MKRPLKRHGEMETLFGADFLPISKKALARPAAAAPQAASKGGGPAPSVAAKPRGGPPAHPWEKDWPADFQSFRSEVLGCRRCGLCGSRTQVVFGTGPLRTPLMFVGEAPGQEEDMQGEPFVGRAGQLLTSTLRKFGVDRSQVFIGNILKCRPPGNRTPAPDEMAACMPWLQRQIAAIQPKLICGLGNIAVQTLLVTKTGITKLRGRITQAQGVPFFPTFHPAYILRNMNDLPLFEGDIRSALQTAGLLPSP